MQTVIRTLLAVALVAACSSDKKAEQEPTPEPTEPGPVAVAPIDAAPTPTPTATDAASSNPTPDPEPTLDPAPDPKTGPNDGPPKNLKVLPRKWSRKKVEKYMKQKVSKALGVKCKECHDTKDFAADGNEHKGEARAMIKMQNDINKRFFEGKSRVSCMTCHMGSKEPAGK